MYRTIEEFDEAWGRESTLTLKILKSLTDESLSQAVAEGHRTLGRLGWHLVTTIVEMAAHLGIKVEGVDPESKPPAEAQAIVDAYFDVTRNVADKIKSEWNDQMLDAEVEVYGQKWKRSFGLLSTVQHQIHHRGQMSVLMRQAGLRVPSLYGPAKEDWAQMGMEPPAV